MKFPLAGPRDYIWGYTGHGVVVRTAKLRDGFRRIDCPQSGFVRFELDVAPDVGRANRRPVPAEQLRSWVASRLGNSGIEVKESEIEPFATHISSLPSRNARLCGSYIGAFVSGIGKVTDAERLFAVMRNGLPGGGPKCWGFGTFIIDGS